MASETALSGCEQVVTVKNVTGRSSRNSRQVPNESRAGVIEQSGPQGSASVKPSPS